MLTQVFDYEHAGFAHLLYWVEIERMALQLAGGQVGEAAVSAARSIINSVPHSAILARCVDGKCTSNQCISLVRVLPVRCPADVCRSIQ
jgi:hypothetical protein